MFMRYVVQKGKVYKKEKGNKKWRGVGGKYVSKKSTKGKPPLSNNSRIYI